MTDFRSIIRRIRSPRTIIFVVRMIRIKYLYGCIAALLMALATQAQVSFSIRVSAAEIFKNDVLQVEYIIRNASTIDNFAPPVFKGWELHSGPMISQETSVINGRSEKQNSYTYMVAPRKPGTLSLPGTTVIADNKHLSCNSVSITVLDRNNPSPIGPPPPSTALQSLFGQPEQEANDPFVRPPELKEGESPAEKIRAGSFVKVTASKYTCYTGEPVMVTYKLYRAVRSRARVIKQPAFTGCSVTEIPYDEQNTKETLGGKPYIVNIIRKVQLQPLQAGSLRLDSAIVENEVGFIVPQEQGGRKTYTATIGNTPTSIAVTPLPKQNKPADFTGITGHFTITAQAKDNNIPAQENNSLLITLTGKGDITEIKPPVVSWPDGTDHFEAATEDNIDKSVFPIQGSRTFAYHFVALHEGNITIPPVRFSYFDVERERYETLSTDSIHFHFTRPTGKKNYALLAGRQESMPQTYWWPAILVLLLAAGGGWWYYYTTRKKNATRLPATTAQVPVVPAAVPNFIIAFDILRNIEDHYLFFNKSKEILELAISEKTGTHNVPFSVLLDLLVQHSAYAHLYEDCKQLHEDCNVAMYSPGMSTSDRTVILDKLEVILKQFVLLPQRG